MRKYAILIIAALSLSAHVGCGSKSSSKAADVPAATTPTPTNPDPNALTCEAWQVATSVGCLNQDPRYCRAGLGYNPADGKCYVGTFGSQIPQGYWTNALQITDQTKFRQMLRDLERCYQSSCPTEPWVFFSLQTIANNQSGYAGAGSQFPWYGASSGAHYDNAAYFPQPQGQQVRVNLITRSQGYWSETINFQFDSQARPVASGFDVIYRGYGTRAYNKRIVVSATYLNSDRSQLQISVKYQDVVVAQGTVNRQ